MTKPSWNQPGSQNNTNKFNQLRICTQGEKGPAPTRTPMTDGRILAPKSGRTLVFVAKCASRGSAHFQVHAKEREDEILRSEITNGTNGLRA